MEKSQVPSPTFMVLDEYVLDPAGESWSLSAGAMTAMGSRSQPKPARRGSSERLWTMGDGISTARVRIEECRGGDAGMRRESGAMGEASFGRG